MLSIAILFSLLVAVIRDHRGHPCESLALAGVVASTLPAVAAVATAFDKAVSGQSELYGIPLAYIDKIIAEHLAKKIGPLVKHREIHANTSSGSSLVLLQKRMNNDPDPNHNFQDESGSDLDEPGPEDQGEVDFEEPADGLDSDWWTPEEVCRDVSGNFVSAYCVDPTSFMYQCAYRDGPLAGQYAQPERGDCPDDTHCVDAVYQEHEMGQEQLPVLYVMCVPDQASLYEGGGDSENMDLQLMAEPIQQGHAQVNFALLDQYNDASVTAILIGMLNRPRASVLTRRFVRLKG
jgi:hypothetical protein